MKNTTIKSVIDFQSMTAGQRANGLKTLVTKASTAKKEIVKILVAAEIAGDFGKGKGEMNTYAMKITGVELRREAQGTYEACNVLRGILASTLAMTEAEFDSKTFGSFPLIMLSGFMGKSPEKVPAALEIIRSGLDVTKRLQELRSAGKEKPASKENSESPAPESPPETQTPSDSTTYIVPLDMPIMNHEEIMSDLMAELKGAATIEDCDTLIRNLNQLRALVESRREVLEMEAAKSKDLVAA